MLRTTGDIGTDDTMISLPRHKPCIYRAYSLVEKININKNSHTNRCKNDNNIKRGNPSVYTREGSGLV